MSSVLSTYGRRLLGAGVFVLVLGTMQGANAQLGGVSGRHLGGNIKYNAGQNVQPIFDGWWQNPDGSFTFSFGYLNRNHVEEVSVPVGPDNRVEPGGPDRSQPAYFYTRFNRRAFTVIVPKDWGKKEVVWTLTHRGQTDRAVGWLQPEWEIAKGLRSGDSSAKNAPPVLTVVPPSSPVALPATLTLTATATDDGFPKPNKRPVITSENPPTFHFPEPQNTPTAPVNVPQVQRPPRTGGVGLSVRWMVWRGPASVAFAPGVTAVKDDSKVVVKASFTQPGEYVLRAIASDTAESTVQDVKVTVTDSRP